MLRRERKFDEKKLFLGPKKTGVLVSSKSFSNLFLTLKDLRNSVITVKTSGSVHVGFSKRKKISPHAVEFIVKNLLIYFKTYNIKTFIIISKVKVSIHMFNLLKQLLKHGFRISTIISRMRVPHNGCRKRKLRRR